MTGAEELGEMSDYLELLSTQALPSYTLCKQYLHVLLPCPVVIDFGP